MPNIDTSKVKSIASEMIDINNRYKDDFSAVEQAINRLKNDWQQPQKVPSAAFACFDEIKAKYFDSAIQERQELAQYLCDAVGIGYEEVEKTNKKLLEGLFDVVATIPSIIGGNNTNTTSTEITSSQEYINSTITVEEFNKRVEQLKNTSGFKQGDYWGADKSVGGKYKNATLTPGYSCCAMARMMQIEIMGASGSAYGQNNVLYNQSFDDIKVGDVVWMNKINGDRSGTTLHYVFVIEKGLDYIKVGEGNAYARNYGTGCVSWENTISKDDIIEIKEIERVV